LSKFLHVSAWSLASVPLKIILRASELLNDESEKRKRNRKMRAGVVPARLNSQKMTGKEPLLRYYTSATKYALLRSALCVPPIPLKWMTTAYI
jgi:hypothetical protein